MALLNTITIAGYRSIRNLQFRLRQLNVVCGPNGSGKSNLYKALRLLASTAQGGLAQAIAQEGGMASILWAGPRKIGPVRLCLSVCTDQFNYEIRFGLPEPGQGLFPTDATVKEEYVWTGTTRRKSCTYFERSSSGAWVMDSDGNRISYSGKLNSGEPILSQLREPHLYPELSILSRDLQGWRFYDHFRTDPTSPLRRSQPGVFTPILSQDGSDLAAALQTISMDSPRALHEAITRVFPRTQLEIANEGCNYWLTLKMPGIFRSLQPSELSDGTLKYLCLLAALMSRIPAPLLVLNEPENSLHPDVLEPLSELIRTAAMRSQVWVTTHSTKLASLLAQDPQTKLITLEKNDEETHIVGQGLILE